LLISLLPLLSALFSGGLLHAQTAAGMDEILNTQEISWAQACRFVLPAAGALNEDAAPGDAFVAAREKGWLPKRAAADSPVNLGGLSYLIIQAFSIKTSFLYAAFPGPHYAYRQLDYLRLIPDIRDPALKVSGGRFLQILSGVLNYQGDGELAAVPEEPLEAEHQEEREQMVRDIQEELDARGVTDTTVRVVTEGVVISLNNIQFLANDTGLTEGERVKLMRVAMILSGYPGRKILVGGHTARAGTAEGRLQVSTQRAQAVADFLVFLGARNPEDIIVQGYGAEQPLADNRTPEGQALNRRVEITLLDE
jgi:outer membrane protein OmpA-like peptidoglycan-associated protein